MESFISSGLIGLSMGTQYALISIGFTLIFGIMGVVNFAHGGFYILGGYFAFSLSHSLGLPYVVAVVLAMFGTAIVGYVIEDGHGQCCIPPVDGFGPCVGVGHGELDVEVLAEVAVRNSLPEIPSTQLAESNVAIGQQLERCVVDTGGFHHHERQHIGALVDVVDEPADQ